VLDVLRRASFCEDDISLSNEQRVVSDVLCIIRYDEADEVCYQKVCGTNVAVLKMFLYRAHFLSRFRSKRTSVLGYHLALCRSVH